MYVVDCGFMKGNRVSIMHNNVVCSYVHISMFVCCSLLAPVCLPTCRPPFLYLFPSLHFDSRYFICDNDYYCWLVFMIQEPVLHHTTLSSNMFAYLSYINCENRNFFFSR